MSHPKLTLICLAGLAFSLAFSAGCTPDKPIVYFCDGSGGGGLIVQWYKTVEDGLREAGYEGEFKNYYWQTGLGAGVDHLADTNYKHIKARELARRIESRRKQAPDQPICVMGLSAGSAIALFAVEELPPESGVDTVILLAPSVSADYPIERTLQHVRGRMYVYTSAEDKVLDDLVEGGATPEKPTSVGRPAGLTGFRHDHPKLQKVPWQPGYSKYGHKGGHTDVTKSEFVTHAIAPRLFQHGFAPHHAHPEHASLRVHAPAGRHPYAMQTAANPVQRSR
jgi:hypothetical protein